MQSPCKVEIAHAQSMQSPCKVEIAHAQSMQSSYEKMATVPIRLFLDE